DGPVSAPDRWRPGNRRHNGFKLAGARLLQRNVEIGRPTDCGRVRSRRPPALPDPAIAHHLRGIEGILPGPGRDLPLAQGIGGRGKAVNPAQVVPVTHVKGLDHRALARTEGFQARQPPIPGGQELQPCEVYSSITDVMPVPDSATQLFCMENAAVAVTNKAQKAIDLIVSLISTPCHGRCLCVSRGSTLMSYARRLQLPDS